MLYGSEKFHLETSSGALAIFLQPAVRCSWEATCPVIPKTGAEKLRRNQMIYLEGPWGNEDGRIRSFSCIMKGGKELVQTVSKNLIL